MCRIVAILGPSGSGKDTMKRLLPIPHLVSYRTRPKRDGEVHGVDGLFVDEADYQSALQCGNIIAPIKFNGYHYWTVKAQFEQYLNNGCSVAYVIEGNGLEEIRSIFGDKVISIWLDVSEAEMKRRMKKRGDTRNNIKSRLNYYRTVDIKNRHFCDYVIDANGTIEDVLKTVTKLLKLK